MTKRGHAAFTLAECAIAMLVIAIAALGCYWGITMASKISRQKMDQPVAWYQFLNKLEDPHRDFAMKRVEANSQRLRLISNDGSQYQLLVSRSAMIYLRKIKSASRGQGYLPLYGPVASQNGLRLRRLDSRRVRIEVTTKDGQKQQSVLCFQPLDPSETSW